MTASRDEEHRDAAYPEIGLRDPDPIPPEVAGAARTAFDSPRPAMLAVLVFDSLLDADEVAEKHILRFQHDQLDVQLHVSAGPGTPTIQGILDRSGPTRAVLHFRDSEKSTVVADVEGATFEFAPAGRGVVRVSLEAEGQGPIWTDWFRI